MKFSDHLSGGVALGVAHNNANVAGGGGYRLQDYSGLGYVTYQAGGGYVGAYGSMASPTSATSTASSRSARCVPTRAATPVARTVAWASPVAGGSSGQPARRSVRHVEWQDIRVNGYHENGSDTTAMWFGDQKRKALHRTLGWRVQGQWQVEQPI